MSRTPDSKVSAKRASPGPKTSSGAKPKVPPSRVPASSPLRPKTPSTPGAGRISSGTKTVSAGSASGASTPQAAASGSERKDGLSLQTDSEDLSLAESKSPTNKARNTKVNVCVRMRPLNQIERRSKQVEAWSCKDGNCIYQTFMPQDSPSLVTAPGSDRKAQPKPLVFHYDYVFTEDKNNAHVYNKICNHVVENAMEGYHGCVFAYGQTSSGKTYTIHGTKDDPGMIPISVDAVFDYIEACAGREFVLRVSYLEIYNEIINDLLDPLNTNLRVREDKVKGVFCEGLKEDVVMSAEQVFALLSAGESHRHVGRTNYNEVSSRSHTIFRIVVESSPRPGFQGETAVQGVRQAVLNLVDLAGSENAVKAGSSVRINETGYINKSLLTLGHVIYKLTENSNTHIPYRDSKLTRILQSSLDGKACVSVVCNISPSSGNLEETISTLKFATRAKKIRGSAKINEVFDETTLLRQYREEIRKLKRELALAKEQNQAMAVTKTTDSEKLEIYQETNALNAQIEQLTRLILTSSGHSGIDDFKNKRGSKILSPYMPMGARRRAVDSDGKEDEFGAGGEGAGAGGAAGVPGSLVMTLAGSGDPHTQLSALMSQVAHLTTKMEAKERELETARSENEQLRKEIDKQNQTLDEWDRYYVSMKNKHQAIQSRMRELAPDPEPEGEGEDGAGKDGLGDPPSVAGLASISEHDEVQDFDDDDFLSPFQPSTTLPLSAAGASGSISASVGTSASGTSTGGAREVKATNGVSGSAVHAAGTTPSHVSTLAGSKPAASGGAAPLPVMAAVSLRKTVSFTADDDILKLDEDEDFQTPLVSLGSPKAVAASKQGAVAAALPRSTTPSSAAVKPVAVSPAVARNGVAAVR